jgi:hypothetical protein
VDSPAKRFCSWRHRPLISAMRLSLSRATVEGRAPDLLVHNDDLHNGGPFGS